MYHWYAIPVHVHVHVHVLLVCHTCLVKVAHNWFSDLKNALVDILLCKCFTESALQQDTCVHTCVPLHGCQFDFPIHTVSLIIDIHVGLQL